MPRPAGPAPSSNMDIEQFPTPDNRKQLDVVQRLEANGKSLRLLCRDLASFIQRAETESTKDITERDPQTMDNTLEYIQRLYALLARISNDIAGHEYDRPNIRPPVETTAMSQGLITNLTESLHEIENTIGASHKEVLIPDPSAYIHAHNDTVALFPFGHWLTEIEKITTSLKHRLHG